MTTEYRIAPHVTVRLVGMLVIGVALMMFAATAVVAALDLHTAWLLLPTVLGVEVLSVAALLITRRGWVVRTTEEGYQVQWVRGVGVAGARWTDVAEAVTTHTAGSPTVVLRLHDGTSSTIPVEVLAIDREQFVRELQGHLRTGQGTRPLT